MPIISMNRQLNTRATRSPLFTRWRSVASVSALAATVSLGACLDLQVNNPNTLDVSNVFNNAANAEAALVGSWRAYHEVLNGSCPTIPFSVWGNDYTTTSGTYLDYSAEPRIPINNRDNLNCTTRYDYNITYEAMAGAREAYQGIVANNLKYGTVNATTPNGSGTPMRLIFAKFIIALGTLKHGLDFDKVFITDEDTPMGFRGETFSPYKDVLIEARRQLREVIADARATADFTFPTNWIAGRPLTRDELIRVCYSYLVRSEAYEGRTPTERAASNWAAILARLDSGITRDFAQQADRTIGATGSTFINNSYAQNTVRISNRFLGPADTSGLYQAWLAAPLASRAAFVITTPDRRIHGATNSTPGTRFTRQTTSMGSATNGSYLLSWYRSTRYLNAAQDSGSTALVVYLGLDEMKFIRAEALFRLGRLAEAAALINPTRIAANLKPVDANGIPAGRDCVPRKNDGTCGTLFDAIQYEKKIETYPIVGGEVAWYDARGWGKLVSGTPYHLPVSCRELLTLGFECYTYGGTGSLGSAP
jgi:hypothetical protein